MVAAVVVLLVMAWAAVARADTLILHDRSQLKGVVVEEHADRYVVSTVDGEVAVLKTQVAGVRYDDPEQSHYQLGRQFQRAGRWQDALKAYQRAVAIRQDFQPARDAVFQIQRLLWQRQDAQLRAELQQKRLVLNPADRSAASPVETASLIRSFDQRFGCTLGYEAGWTVIASVEPDSPAARAGLQPRDLVVAVWGEPIRHLDPLAISGQLEAGGRELQLTIERVAAVPLARGIKPPWGFTLALGYEGLQVTAVTTGGPAEGRVAIGDLLVAIGDQPTRYLPLPQVRRLLSQPSGNCLLLQHQVLLQERLA